MTWEHLHFYWPQTTGTAKSLFFFEVCCSHSRMTQMPPMVPGGSFHPQSKNVHPAVRGPRGKADPAGMGDGAHWAISCLLHLPSGRSVSVDTKPSFLQEESRSVPSFKWRRWDLTDGAVTDSLFPMQRAQVQSLVRELDCMCYNHEFVCHS